VPISIVCPSCYTRLRAPDHMAGDRVRCPKCATSVPVPAYPSGRRGGCFLLLLWMSLLVNLVFIGGFFVLGFMNKLDRVAWFWEQLPFAGRSPEAVAEEIVTGELKALNDLAEGVEKAKDAEQTKAPLTEYTRTLTALVTKTKDLDLSKEAGLKAYAKAMEKHGTELAKARGRVGLAFAKLGIIPPALPTTVPSSPPDTAGGSPKATAEEIVTGEVKALTALAEGVEKAKDAEQTKAPLTEYTKTLTALMTKSKDLDLTNEAGLKAYGKAMEKHGTEFGKATTRVALAYTKLGLTPPTLLTTVPSRPPDNGISKGGKENKGGGDPGTKGGQEKLPGEATWQKDFGDFLKYRDALLAGQAKKRDFFDPFLFDARFKGQNVEWTLTFEKMQGAEVIFAEAPEVKVGSAAVRAARFNRAFETREKWKAVAPGTRVTITGTVADTRMGFDANMVHGHVIVEMGAPAEKK
jgi:DNA/RNA-binding domain of Phe-tRNA-synthetase-like protein